jgi:transketolase
MRNNFAEALYEEGKKDNKICVVVADISPAGSIQKFRNEFPDRFINCGVAEQSMIGIAAGLALKGFRPFCYTIATFTLYRPFEMVRVDLCYQNLPVTIIGMGAGAIYSTLGGTHHTIEDVAVASALPNMTVIAPCDPSEMKEATKWCATKNRGPVYMRLGKVGEPNLTENAIDKFEFGKIRYLKKGKEIAIISYGITVKIAIELSIELEKQGKSVSVISCHTIKPLDKVGIKKVLNEYKSVYVLEEHVPHGGLSSRVKEIASDEQTKAELKSFTLKDEFIHFYGNHQELLEKHELSVKQILKKI